MKKFLYWQGNLLLSEQAQQLIDLIRRCAECGVSAIVVADPKLGLLNVHDYNIPMTTSGMIYCQNWGDIRNAAAYRNIELVPLVNTYGPELLAWEPTLQEPGTESRPVACLGNRDTYMSWERIINDARVFTQAKRCFLGFCELRHGGVHQACKGIPYGWAARQFQDLALAAGFEQTMMWSDMFCPADNCHSKYYDLKLPYSGAADYLDRNQIVVPWRRQSALANIKYLSVKKLPTLLSMDVDNVSDEREWVRCTLEELVTTWLEAAGARSRIEGAMYTTWTGKYDLLEQWAGMVDR